MARYNFPITSFLAGEASPKLWARTDTQQYRQSCKSLHNMILQIQGGISRRPGTISYHVDTYDVTASGGELEGSNYARGFSYITSAGERFAIIFCADQDLEFSDGGVWAVKLGLVGSSPNADSAVQTFFLPESVSADTYLQNKSFTETQLREFQCQQVGDTLFFTHKDLEPMVYTPGNLQTYFNWANDSTWLGDFSSWETRPYLEPRGGTSTGWKHNDGTIQVDGVITTGGTVDLVSSDGIFDPGHVGAYFKFSKSSETGVAQVTSYTDAATVEAEVIHTIPGTSGDFFGEAAGTSWEEQAWSDYRGWPRAIAFLEERLWFGGTYSNPGRVWGTRTANLKRLMHVPFEDDDDFVGYNEVPERPFYFDIGAGSLDLIQWIVPNSGGLAIGTTGSEFFVYGGEDTISLINRSVDVQSSHGSVYMQPAVKDKSIYFMQRDGETLRDFVYRRDSGGYVSRDLSALADHILAKNALVQEYTSAPKATRIVYSTSPTDLIWVIDNTGSLYSMTLNDQMGVAGFHRHTIGGAGDGDRPPKVLDICVIPSPAGQFDMVMVVVRRYINGTFQICYEYIAPEFKGSSLAPSNSNETLKPIYLDAAQYRRAGTYDFDIDLGMEVFSEALAATTTFYKFTKFIGETLHVVADGHYLGEYEVNASGEIVLDDPYWEIVAGYVYTPIAHTVALDAGGNLGSGQGMRSRVEELFVKFYGTAAAQIGTSADNLEEVDFRPAELGLAEDDLTPLHDGGKTVLMPGGYHEEAEIYITTDKPYPLNVAGIFASGTAYD